MLSIASIKQAYPSNYHAFERGLLREYLQYQILSLIFEHPLSRKLSFLGGTCLRIVHQLPRFSEDIDFDNTELSEVEFETLGFYLQKQLEKLGYVIEIRFVSKAAFHCHIKFPDLLYKSGISAQKSEKILIQFDTFDQGVEYHPELFILDKFEFFTQIQATPKDILLSQKFWTITQRNRLKGRDFFDTMFLLQTAKPNLAFLQAKFGKQEMPEIIHEILNQLKDIDYSKLADDVRPFLLNPSEADKITLFPNFLKQMLSKSA